MNPEIGRKARYFAIAVGSFAGATAMVGCVESGAKTQQRLVTIEPEASATLESRDNVEVTRANYTKFLSSDPNVTFGEVVSDFVSGVDYLRETGGLNHKGVNLVLGDTRDSTKLTIISSQEQLMGLMLPLETNMNKKVQAILFALFDNVVEAKAPAVIVEPGVLHTTMKTRQKFGCFEADNKGNAIIPELTIGVTVDFVNKSIGYDFPKNQTNPITNYDSSKAHVCID